MEKVVFEFPVQFGDDFVLKEMEADSTTPLPGSTMSVLITDDHYAAELDSPWTEEGGMEAGRSHREFDLGSASGVPQVKTEMERQCVGSGWARVCIKVPVLYRRSAKFKLIARVSTGKLTNNEIWKAVNGCVIRAAAIAGAASLIAGYASGGSAALATFKASFVPALKSSLLSKADQVAAIASDVRVDLRVDSESGEWKRAS